MIVPIVDDDVVLVGIMRPEVFGPVFLLLRANTNLLSDFLTQVPVKCQMVAETCDEFSR